MTVFPFIKTLNCSTLCVYSTKFLIHSSVNEHVNWLHILAILNNAAVNVGVLISLQDSDLNSLR